MAPSAYTVPSLGDVTTAARMMAFASPVLHPHEKLLVVSHPNGQRKVYYHDTLEQAGDVTAEYLVDRNPQVSESTSGAPLFSDTGELLALHVLSGLEVSIFVVQACLYSCACFRLCFSSRDEQGNPSSLHRDGH